VNTQWSGPFRPEPKKAVGGKVELNCTCHVYTLDLKEYLGEFIICIFGTIIGLLFLLSSLSLLGDEVYYRSNLILSSVTLPFQILFDIGSECMFPQIITSSVWIGFSLLGIVAILFRCTLLKITVFAITVLHIISALASIFFAITSQDKLETFVDVVLPFASVFDYCVFVWMLLMVYTYLAYQWVMMIGLFRKNDYERGPCDYYCRTALLCFFFLCLGLSKRVYLWDI